MSDYEKFEEIVTSKLRSIYYGYTAWISFQDYGFSDEQVHKFWRKMRRSYALPRAKRIKQAVISF